MIIHGKEYKFLYTVRASIEIAQNLDGHSMTSISKVFQTGDQIKSMEQIFAVKATAPKAEAPKQEAEEILQSGRIEWH